MSWFRRHEAEEQSGSEQGSLNGATSVEIVPAPAAGFVHRVDCVRFFNCDTAQVDITIRKTLTGPTHYAFDRSPTLAVNGFFAPVTGQEMVRLTATDESITAVMGGAAATTNPTWIASWVKVPVPV